MNLDISLMHDSNLVLFSTFRVFGQFQCLMTIFLENCCLDFVLNWHNDVSVL